jgi:hypothetical protein
MRRSAALAAAIGMCGCYDLDRLRDGADAAEASAPDLSASFDGDVVDLARLADLGGTTGSPCTSSAECVGPNQPSCILGGGTVPAWPGGYCSGACVPAENGDAGNPDCSGVGYCVALAPTAIICIAPCGAPGSCRAGYSCFYFGCIPTADSPCDPQGSTGNKCPFQDGGLPQDGGGTGPIICMPYGLDSVGVCAAECQMVPQDCPGTEACYPNPRTGLAGCLRPFTGAGSEGAPCLRIPECARGLTCDGNVCRKLCRTGGVTFGTCPNGTTCGQLGNLPTTTVGVCR